MKNSLKLAVIALSLSGLTSCDYFSGEKPAATGPETVITEPAVEPGDLTVDTITSEKEVTGTDSAIILKKEVKK